LIRYKEDNTQTMKLFRSKKLLKIKLAGIILLAITLFSCNKDLTYINLPAYGPTQVFYALTPNNALTTYNAKDVRTQTASVNITGLTTSETMLGIDFRPATGELYGVSSLSKIYIINISTGAARAVSATPFSPLLSGTITSIDFNPTADRLRIVTNRGQNLRLNPETGQVVATDANVGSSSLSGIAYSNSYAGATATVLYDIDPTAGKLYKQDPPNEGTLVSVGNLGVDLGSNVDFDISPDGANALTIGKVGDSTKLYTISLTTGKATLAGKFVLGTNIRSIAMASNPAAYAVDNANNFLIFNPTLATTVIYSKSITGLQAGETIYGMDMSPVNGQIYALSSSSKIYTVNIGTAEFTLVGTLATALSGTSFGFDFVPSTGAIQVVSNTGQNLQINTSTFAITTNPTITTTTATLSAAAFNNNFTTATSSTLFVIDHTVDKLFSLAPTTGVLAEIGELKIGEAKLDIGSTNGFDISPNNAAYGIFTVGGKTSVYTLDLGSGLATVKFDLSLPITAFTLGRGF